MTEDVEAEEEAPQKGSFFINRPGAKIIPLWSVVGGYQNGAEIISGIANESKISVIEKSADGKWFKIRALDDPSLEGWCDSSYVIEVK